NDVTLHIFVKGAVQRTVTSAACSGILTHQAVFPGENASKAENCEPQCYGHGVSISIKKLALNVIYSTIILFRIEMPHQAVIFCVLFPKFKRYYLQLLPIDFIQAEWYPKYKRMVL
ncbi:MAG: hypothetical protein Q3Y17_18465, partial [Blautia sp.]|nr:hypothetical protein [Blautia sp.]